MTETLANYVVGVGIKGQNVALTEINKIKKAGASLAKLKPKVNFSNVRAEINARKQVDAIKRQTQATRGQVELQKMQEKQFEKISGRAQSVASTGSGALQNAMTGGSASIVSALPAIGGIFSASQSAIEAAAQEYVAGITASKNIQLVRSNYARAFSGAVDSGMSTVLANGTFSDRAAKAFYTSLADQGVNAKTVAAAAPGLDLLAKSQGVGSIDELMGRLQSGTLKENAGLSKADIVLLQSQAQLLNNRFTADIGAQMITQTLQRLAPQMQAVAGTQGMRGLSRVVRGEGNIREREESFASEATSSAFSTAYEQGFQNRRADRADRMRFQRVAQMINRGTRRVTQDAMNRGQDVLDVATGDFRGAYERNVEQRRAEMEEVRRQREGSGQSEGGGSNEDTRQGPQSGGGPALSSVNNDIARSGQAVADTLMQINNRLNVINQQMGRR